ncbi:MAG: hypothetical protein HOV87_18830 [Catenulispora sp.]|nr:hypothetical protein [Catenulispora sp.]
MRAVLTAARDAHGLLDLCERAWAPALRGRVLVAEAEPERHGDLLAAASTALSGQDADTAAERWPASLLMAVVGTVCSRYCRGSVWGVWWRACGGRKPSFVVAEAWDCAFRNALSSFGLPVFAELSADDALLVHAGVPDAFLEELCSTLVGDTGKQASRPVALLLGRPEAAAFLARCRNAMVAIRDSATTEDTEDTEDTQDTQDTEAAEIPQRLAKAMARFRAGRDHRGAAAGSALAIEPFGRGPLLVGADGLGVPATAAVKTGRLYVFSQDGVLVPEDVALSPGPAWLLYPVGAAPEAEGKLVVIAHGSLPLRWAGWSLVEADLRDVAWLRSREPGAARRVVGGRSKPVLVTGKPVQGLSHGAGRPVVVDAPVLRLPAGEVEWSVEVRGHGGGVLARERVRGAPETATETSGFWRRVPRPLLGQYSVRVGGANGPGLVRTVVVAEGLGIHWHPDVRLLRPDGLEPAEAVFHPGAGMTTVPAGLTFGTDRARLPVEAVTRQHREVFLVEPPRMRVRVDGGAYDHDAEAIRPPRLTTAGLAVAGRIFVELPGLARPPELDVVAGGRVVQRVRPHRDGGYNLRRILDTVAFHSDTVLRLVHDGREATVAWIHAPEPSQDPWLPGTTGAGRG